MKKLSIVVVIILCITLLVGCSPSDYIQQITESADTYTMVLAYDSDNHRLTAVQTLNMTNRCDNSLNAVKMHIFANAYRQDATYNVVPNSYVSIAYPNGISYGNIAIDYVKVSGTQVAFTIEGRDSDILSIPLANELFPDESIDIEISYTVTLANMSHRLGYTDDTVNLGNFYPILCAIKDDNYNCTPYYATGDPFVSEMANYDVTITVPAEYKIASTGQLQTTTDSELGTTYHYKANAVRDFAMVLSTRYNVKSYQDKDTTLYYYYYNDSQPDATMANILGTYNFMNTNVGKYPYSTLTVAESNFCYGGMEYPQMVMISSATTEYNIAVSHEIIHQWFYGLIGNDQIANAWMDEGLTEFVTMLYFDSNMNTPLATSIKKTYKAYITYIDVLSHYLGKVDTSYRSLDEYKNDQEYVYTTYVKGSIMFYNIYNTMGSTKFYKALSTYFDQCKGSTATVDDMIRCFSSAFGSSMQSLFDSYIEGKEILTHPIDPRQ